MVVLVDFLTTLFSGLAMSAGDGCKEGDRSAAGVSGSDVILFSCSPRCEYVGSAPAEQNKNQSLEEEDRVAWVWVWTPAGCQKFGLEIQMLIQRGLAMYATTSVRRPARDSDPAACFVRLAYTFGSAKNGH